MATVSKRDFKDYIEEGEASKQMMEKEAPNNNNTKMLNLAYNY